MAMCYMITYFVPQRISWLEWRERMETEYAKTKADLDVLLSCILEDNSIVRAFYEDVANGKITHVKANGKPLP